MTRDARGEEAMWRIFQHMQSLARETGHPSHQDMDRWAEQWGATEWQGTEGKRKKGKRKKGGRASDRERGHVRR